MATPKPSPRPESKANIRKDDRQSEKNPAGEKSGETSKDLKQKFDRPAHLTHRPFQGSDALRALQSDMHKRKNAKKAGVKK